MRKLVVIGYQSDYNYTAEIFIYIILKKINQKIMFCGEFEKYQSLQTNMRLHSYRGRTLVHTVRAHAAS